jgi:hypothetical protein
MNPSTSSIEKQNKLIMIRPILLERLDDNKFKFKCYTNLGSGVFWAENLMPHHKFLDMILGIYKSKIKQAIGEKTE